jgi:hypothetical protein
VEEGEEEDMNGEEYEAQEMEDQFEAAAASFSGTSEVRTFNISRGNVYTNLGYSDDRCFF